LDSEADLDEEIKNMATLSADPSLYPYLITLNAIDSIVSLLAHENSDISLAAIELLNTLTDQKDNIEEDELEADAVKGVSLLIRHLVSLGKY
jgi:beta-catenin-like protein 1